jgi:hypothetical protein
MDKEKAPVVVEGIVESVDEHWTLDTDYYTVWVRIDRVEKGEAVRAGDSIAVSCFRWSRPCPLMSGASGHDSIPDVGDRIRAFAYPRDRGFEGNYPHWYDLLALTNAWWPVRVWRYRKVQWFCVAAGIVVALCVLRKLARIRSARRRAQSALPIASKQAGG